MKTITNGTMGKSSGAPIPHDDWKAQHEKMERREMRNAHEQTGGGDAVAGEGLESLNVPELKERAKAANIEGFSQMNKAELIAALSK